MSGSATWVHRPPRGPVAWGAAVLTAPTVPLLSFFTLLVLLALVPGDENELPVVLSPVPWLLVGALLARPVSRRIMRGIGIGLFAGAVATLVLAAMASYGGWR